MKQAFLEEGQSFFKSKELSEAGIVTKSIPTMYKKDKVDHENEVKPKKKKVPKEVKKFVSDVEEMCTKFDKIIEDIEMQKGHTVNVTKMMNDFANFKQNLQYCLNDIINYPQNHQVAVPESGDDKSRVNISKY